jgi:histidine triad (HIT) family protein
MYNHAPENYVCPLCLLASGTLLESSFSQQSDIVFQDEFVTAFIGSHQWPRNLGHVIIIPNEHFENIYDLPLRLATKIHECARTISLALKAAYHCDGTSTRQHNEPAGNQEVWHYHLHVFPRYAGDELYASRRQFVPAAERAEYAHRLRMQLKAGLPSA